MPIPLQMNPPAIICPAPPAPAVSVESLLKTPVIRRDKSIKALSEERRGLSAAARAEFPITSGLTRGSITANFRVEMAYRQVARGSYCLWPQSAKVTLSYVPEVFIASDYPQGRCRYEDTLHHELRHVKMDQDIVAQQVPLIREMAAKRMAGMTPPGPLPAATLAKVQAGFVGNMKAALQSYMRDLGALRAQKQATIDTRQEYLRASRACAR